MNRTFISLLFFLLGIAALQAQTIDYKGTSIELGPHAFFVDGSLTEAEAAASPYLFQTLNEAVLHLQDGTPSNPMRVYIAPWVYWIDDPDNPAVRTGENGRPPIGLTVRCESLQLLGNCNDPRKVVLASARGQTQGASGNFTMFDFYGNDLVIRDLTMGNYCNIDLEYPWKPELERRKRNSAITQAQLAFCHGDRILAENVHFMARLNLCPLAGAKRILFVGCHMECTDDSLTSTGVYLGCDFDFWGRQPFGSVDRFGTVFLDCDFHIRHNEPIQAVSKSCGRVSLIDCRYDSGGRPLELVWTFRPEEWLRCYQYGITKDDMPVMIGAAKPWNTVFMDRKTTLSAFRLVNEDGSVLYNTYNLLRGEDDWDPQGIREKVRALGLRDTQEYARIANCLDLTHRKAALQTGGETVTINASVLRHGGYPIDNQEIHWFVESGFERFVSLSTIIGSSCTVTPANHEDATQTFGLFARTDEGLEAAVEITVAPDFVEPPSFLTPPRIILTASEAQLDYALDLGGRKDESLITWYRCDDRAGNNAIPVQVSRETPLKTYSLTQADVGHFLMVGISPKHLRCEAGTEVRVVLNKPIRLSQVRISHIYETDFSDFPCDNQPAVLPGYWTVDAFKPEDTAEYQWSIDPNKTSWTYGPGINGAKGLGIQQLQQGARLRYTPLDGKYGDMKVTWQVDPAKDGGQGFASARQQYLDLFIKFDTETLTGYALRVIRTIKFSNAVDMLLVKYSNGSVEPISESISTDCFLTGCTLSVEARGNGLYAHVEGPNRPATPVNDARIRHTVDLHAEMERNPYGGFGLQHTSTVGAESRILIHSVCAEWGARISD
ncbi:MAG: hypothetical protein ACOX5T_05660 [Candidatus Cryptobacteroides sp.]|jgi:hypothetical protein